MTGLSAGGRKGRRLQVRVERRDAEIEHLRGVWGTLLTSHPNLDRSGPTPDEWLEGPRPDPGYAGA